MSVRVWFTTLGIETGYGNQESANIANWAKVTLKKGNCHRYRLADSADLADVILIMGSAMHKSFDYPRILQMQGLVQKYSDRCFTFDYGCDPILFLPGVYVSLQRQRIDPIRVHAGGYLGRYNSFVTSAPNREPRLLASFRGSASAPVRRRLFQMKSPKNDWSVIETYKWFTHDESDKQTYADELHDSKFVLCPRGVGTASGRLFETMAAGRVPVILSDDWAAPVGPPWLDFAIFVGEDRVEDLPSIIEQFEPEWRQRGQLAREIYEQWYRPEAGLYRTLQYIEDLLLRRSPHHDEREYHENWSSWRFKWENGWTLPQRVYRTARAGRLTQAIRRRLIVARQ